MPGTTLLVARDGHDRNLSPSWLEQLRDTLEDQRRFRVDQLRRLTLPDNDEPADGANAEVTRTLIAAARADLLDVQAALCRMAEGRYGWCTDCGAAMEIVRLEIMPQIARCLSCHRAADCAPLG